MSSATGSPGAYAGDGTASAPEPSASVPASAGLSRIRRIARVRAVGAGMDLGWSTRCPVIDQLFNADPTGELVIQVPAAAIDPLATVLAVDLAC